MDTSKFDIADYLVNYEAVKEYLLVMLTEGDENDLKAAWDHIRNSGYGKILQP